MGLIKKIVTVGDGDCGKTCLLTTYAYNEFPETHVPTVFDTYSKEIRIEGEEITLALWDTAGEEDYDRLRPLSYPRTSVVLICFAIDYPDSLANVRQKWWPEVEHFLPHVPVLLVGNKLDLRSDPGIVESLRRKKSRPVSRQEGERVARKIGAVRYMECSAKYLLGVKSIFEEAIRVALAPTKDRGLSRYCNML
ncbi:hypothetical protein JTB14_008562 [Gonioctena quinquepunctata]|nr:hypothetical protein JTB14_008562 [Gonioctena quinquepunctata]